MYYNPRFFLANLTMRTFGMEMNGESFELITKAFGIEGANERFQKKEPCIDISYKSKTFSITQNHFFN